MVSVNEKPCSNAAKPKTIEFVSAQF